MLEHQAHTQNHANLHRDGNIRYYEYENDKFEYLTQYTSANPQRGIAFLPKRGINLHDNEVLRAFKTVNDAYVEPVSFIVPRRSEMFQSDIYPPCVGLTPGTSTTEWFAGKTALPPKISLESVFDGEPPKEVSADIKPAKPVVSESIAPKAEPPKPAPEPTPAPAPIASRGPPPSMTDNKQSLAAGASKFADDDASDKDSESSFEEVAKPVARPSVIASRQAEKAKEPEPAPSKPTPAPTPAAAAPSQSAQPAESSHARTVSSAGGPASALRDALSDIKSQLEHQNRVMSDQSDQIALLLREVSQLKTKVGGAGAEPSDREKDERIRQLELELEEARS